MFHVHAPMTIDDLPVRVFEEYTPTGRGLEPMAIDPALILGPASAAARATALLHPLSPPRRQPHGF